MTTQEIKQILGLHAKWGLGKEGGQRANLFNVNLRDANLFNADLFNADLRGANLSDANLRGANLRDANLFNADLRGANLFNADLRGANLIDANLSGANLRGANLSGANLRGAKGHFCFGPMPTSGRIVHCTWHVEFGWMVKAGCFWGDLDELEAKVKSHHNCAIYLGMIAFLRTYKPA